MWRVIFHSLGRAFVPRERGEGARIYICVCPEKRSNQTHSAPKSIGRKKKKIDSRDKKYPNRSEYRAAFCRLGVESVFIRKERFSFFNLQDLAYS